MVGKTKDGSKPCEFCLAYTKIKLPCGSWVCPLAVLGAASHSVPMTTAKAA